MPERLPQSGRNAELESLANAHLRRMLPPLWTFARPERDVGIDHIVEIFEGGVTTGFRFNVQLKATDKPKLAHGYLESRCKVSTLNYHLQCHDPTMYVVYDACNNAAYFEWSSDYLERLTKDNPAWRSRKTVCVRVRVTNTLVRASAVGIVSHVRAHRSARADRLTARMMRDLPLQTRQQLEQVNLPTVFISYSGKDRSFAARLASDLRDHGINVWFDQWKIRVGDSIIQKVSDGLRQQDHLIVVLSPDSVSSAWVQRELAVATSRQLAAGQTTLLPVLYRQCDIPAFLAPIRYADFRENYDQGFSELLSAVLPETGRLGSAATLVAPAELRASSDKGGVFIGYRSPVTKEDYYLHSKLVTLRGGRCAVIYFFSRNSRRAGLCNSIPPGYRVVGNPRTGHPILVKSKFALGHA